MPRCTSSKQLNNLLERPTYIYPGTLAIHIYKFWNDLISSYLRLVLLL